MRYTYTIIALFCFGWIVLYADRTALFPLLPVIADDLHLSATQAGAIASAYFLVYVLAQPLAGAVGDRFGLKRMLVAMVSLAGLALLGLALLVHEYVPLLLFIAVHGAGAGVYYPAAYSITMYTVPPERRGISSGIIGSGMSLGTALGLAASGPLYLATASWRAPYLALALPTLVLALLCALLIRPIQPRRPSAQASWRVLRDPTLLCLDAMIFCSLYGFWVAVTWGPSFFQAERGLGLGVAGLYTALIAVAALPAGLLAGRISDRLGRRRLSLILLPLAAVAILGLVTVQSLEGLVVALIAYGLVGKLALDPVSVAWAGDRVTAVQPQAMGVAIGVFSFAGMSSAVVAPLVSGWIKDVTGSLAGAFYVAAVVVLAGTLFAALARESKRETGPSPAAAPAGGSGKG